MDYVCFNSYHTPERELLSFSDFYKPVPHEPRLPELDEATLELKVLVLNINKGYNEELKERCRPLRDYCIYIDTMKKHLSEKMSLEEAVDLSIDECIKDGIMGEFLREQKAEVRSMSILECDYEEELKKIKKFERDEGREEGREEGWEEGREEGREEGKDSVLKELTEKKLAKGITDPAVISDMLEIDIDTVKRILDELCHK